MLRTSGAWIEGEDRSRSVPLNSIHPAQLVIGLARESSDGGLRIELAGRMVDAKRSPDLDLSRFQQFRAPSYQAWDCFATWQVTPSVRLNAGVAESSRCNLLVLGERPRPARRLHFIVTTHGNGQGGDDLSASSTLADPPEPWERREQT